MARVLFVMALLVVAGHCKLRQPRDVSELLRHQPQEDLSDNGYYYPKPTAPPQVVRPQPLPIFVPQSRPQPIPVYVPQTRPQPIPIYVPQSRPQPIPQFVPQPSPEYVPQPRPIVQPEPIYVQTTPAPIQPIPQYVPQPRPIIQPQPLPQYVPQPRPVQPQTIYGTPNIDVRQPNVESVGATVTTGTSEKLFWPLIHKFTGYYPNNNNQYPGSNSIGFPGNNYPQGGFPQKPLLGGLFPSGRLETAAGSNQGVASIGFQGYDYPRPKGGQDLPFEQPKAQFSSNGVDVL